MILLIGDLHLVPAKRPLRTGRVDDEIDLLACIDSISDSLTHVVLLGDVFDAFVEYRYVVPRGAVRLLGQLARLSDAGVDVTYVVGNHDPWHRSLVQTDLGLRLVRGSDTRDMNGIRLHVSHGDREEASGGSVLARIVRHPVSLALYTSLLPGDSGQALAQWVSRSRRRAGSADRTALLLEAHALDVLARGDIDVVALGHSHRPVLRAMNGGVYVNPGLWPDDRMVGLIDDRTVTLAKWDDGFLRAVDQAHVGAETGNAPESLPRTERRSYG